MPESIRSVLRTAAVLAAISFAAPHVSHAAEAYPSRPVRLIVPFPAGGPTDIVGRLFAEKLAGVWGRPVVVDNRPGASGIIGVDLAAKAAPDGYTVLFGSTSTFAVNSLVMKKLPYDIVRDFALVGLASNGPHVLMVRNGFPAKTAADFIALAKKNPGKLKYGSSGTGTIIQMSAELFKLEAGVDVTHVPYKGGGPSVIALLGGEVDMIQNDLSVVLPHVKSGRGVGLAAAHTSRLAPLPDVPTFAEVGYPGVIASTWFGVALPAKTPREIRARLADAYQRVVTSPEYKERLAVLAMEPLVLDQRQTSEFLKREIAKWKKVVDATGIRLE